MQIYRQDTTKTSGFDTLIVTKENLSAAKPKIDEFYINPLVQKGANVSTVVTFSIYTKDNPEKLSVKLLDKLCKNLFEFINEYGIKNVYIIDKEITNRISGNKNINMREIFQLPQTGSARYFCGVNYKTLNRTPTNEQVLDQSLTDLKLSMDGMIVDTNASTLVKRLGIELFTHETVKEVEDTLNKLLLAESLGLDIEAYSLKYYEADIGSIALSPNKQESHAFSVNFKDTLAYTREVKNLLREFFTQYKNQKIFYNSLYDVKVLTYNLFMKDYRDIIGMRNGMDLLYANCEDPLFMAFCLKNSTLKPDLKLKTLLYPYFGNYGIDVTDISLHTKEELLFYNNLDSCGMHYIYEDLKEELALDPESEGYYKFQLLENRKVVTECEIVGMPINLHKVKALNKELNEKTKQLKDSLTSLKEVKKTELLLAGKRFNKNFSNRGKVKTVKDYHEPFNFGSSIQMSSLLYDTLGLPVLLNTEKGNPSTSNDTLNMLKESFSNDEKIISILDPILEMNKYTKLLTAFLPAFVEYTNGISHLCGNLNPIGTVSGRFSSSKPNLQQLPKYQPVQECFECEDDEVFFSADFLALEDKASAIKTNDSKKIEIFIKDLDPHAFKASYYFEDLMENIDRSTKESVLDIKNRYPVLRQDSKTITFGKTYGGGDQFLERKGYDPARIALINKGWNILTAESIAYEQKFKAETSAQGYTRLLFGLKLHTPTMANPYADSNLYASEARTAFNAHTQCFGMLNTRAAEEFLRRVRNAPKEIQESVRLSNLIHDNIVGICKAKPHIIKWVNDNLIECMSWQDDDYIRHDKVPLTTDMEIGHNWFDFITIANNAPIEEVTEALNKVEEKRNSCQL